MTSLADARVLFVATAGARQASASLVQYLLVARMLGVRPLIAMPGQLSAAEAAVALGADVIPQAIAALNVDVVVVDDTIAAQIAGWIIAAQRAGALVVTLHELGASALRQSGQDEAPEFAMMPVAAAAAAGRRELR